MIGMTTTPMMDPYNDPRNHSITNSVGATSTVGLKDLIDKVNITLSNPDSNPEPLPDPKFDIWHRVDSDETAKLRVGDEVYAYGLYGSAHEEEYDLVVKSEDGFKGDPWFTPLYWTYMPVFDRTKLADK